ncbi:MAG: MFS transporter [Opitutales bacterium]|nr:MFS transporter [Opitutales bacterium]MBT5167172.1 MFS transporter [Opitutales bacterium]MBT5816556.1 MFS transporter [Opitutales bacterium]
MSDRDRAKAQRAALLSQLFALMVTMVIAGEYMMLYANDVLGLSPQKIALIFSLAPFFSALRLPAIPYIQRFGLVRTLRTARALQSCVILTFIAVPAAYMEWPVLSVLVMMFVMFRELGLGTVWQPLMRNITTQEDRGSFFGRMRTWFTVVNLLLSGGIALFVGQQMGEGAFKVILTIAFLGTLNSIFWARLIPEPIVAQDGRLPGLWRSAKHVWFLLRRSKLFRLPLIIALVITSGQVPIGIVYFREVLHVPVGILGAQIFCMTLGQVVSLILWGKVSDAMGFRPMLTGLLGLTSGLLMILWFVQPFPIEEVSLIVILNTSALSVGALMVFGFVGGVLNAGVGISLTAVTHYHVSSRDSLANLNLFAMFQLLFQSSLMLILGTYIQQFVQPRIVPADPDSLFYFDWYKVYSAGLVPVLMILCIPLALRLPNVKPWFGVNDFFSAIRYTPWRSLMGRRRLLDEDEDHRIELARSLGDSRNPLNIEPLAELLQDPSLEVKIEAIRSLARSRSDFSGQKLVEILKDKERRSLWDHAAWALGELRYFSAVDLLIERLEDSSPARARAMAARALGKIGDPRAIDSVLRVLNKESRSLHVIAGCCWALLHLDAHEHADIAFRGLMKLREREERYEMLSIFSRWLSVTDRWILLSNSRATAWESLNAFLDEFSNDWRGTRSEVIEIFKKRDRNELERIFSERVAILEGEERELPTSLLTVLKETSDWSPLCVLGTAYLLLG